MCWISGVEYAMNSATNGTKSDWNPCKRDIAIPMRLKKEMDLLDKEGERWNNKRVLDIGIGDGPYVVEYLRRGFTVIGLDNDLEISKPLRKYFGEDINFLLADGKQIPLRSECVDVVFMCELLEHLNDPSKALEEAFRVMKPGGYLFIDVPWWMHLFSPVSAFVLRQLQHFKASRKAPLSLMIFFDFHNGRVSRRWFTTAIVKLFQLLYPKRFQEISPESLLEKYPCGTVEEGMLHLHFYFPSEWVTLVEEAGFKIKTLSGAWLRVPLLSCFKFFDCLFHKLETRLGDGILSKISHILIIEAIKPEDLA